MNKNKVIDRNWVNKLTMRKIMFPSPSSWRVYSIQHYVIVCQSFDAGLQFSPCTPISSTNKTDRHYITEILLKVAMNIITSQMHPPIKLTISNTFIVRIYSIHRQFVHEINLTKGHTQTTQQRISSHLSLRFYYILTVSRHFYISLTNNVITQTFFVLIFPQPI